MTKTLHANPARIIPTLKEKLPRIWDEFGAEGRQKAVNTMPYGINAVIKNYRGVTQW